MEAFMLLTITEYKDLDKRKLMDIYSESNYENTDFFYPDEADKEADDHDYGLEYRYPGE